MCFFFYISRHFFASNLRRRAKKTKCPKKKIALLAQCSRPPDWQLTHQTQCVERSTLIFFFNFQTMIELNSFQLPWKFHFSRYMIFPRRQRTFSTPFNQSTLRTHSSGQDRSLNGKLERVLDSKSNAHPGFVKARPRYSQQSPRSAISTGGIP